MEDETYEEQLPHGDQEVLEPFDVREHSGRRGMMMLLSGFLILLLLAFVVMKLFSSGTRDRDQPPRILASDSPYKEVPADRGGVETPNQDKEIYDVLNGTAGDSEVKIVETSEQPMKKPKPIEMTTPVANVVIKDREKKPATTITPPKRPAATPAPRPAQDPIVTGDYVVQIASLRSLDEAESMWTKISGKMSGVLTRGHVSDIKRVNLQERGVYYRLRVGGLADKAAADRLCARLKSSGQDCIVTRR